MNVCLETFGCRLNRAEALEDEARYVADGHRIVRTHAEADLIVVRGCSVTARAQKDCERLIRHLEEKYPGKRIVTVGCLPSAKRRDAPLLSEASKMAVPTRTARAYLKVQDGCSGRCSFCIVPQFRGKSSSVPFDEVMDRARRFIESGYHEIVVTGCNLSLYASGGRRLPELAAALAALSPDCRIRLGSVEPGACAHEVVHAMAENERICRFLHIPVQSGSNRILAAMRRPYQMSDVDSLVAEAMTLMPLVGIGCDLIAGFPDETEVDFRLTQGFLARHVISNAHVFPFSPRPGTLAAGLPGALPTEIRHARARYLSELAQESRRKFAKRFVGRFVDVVVESDSAFKGWTSEYLWFEKTRMAAVGSRPLASHRKEKMRFQVRAAHGGVLYGDCR